MVSIVKSGLANAVPSRCGCRDNWLRIFFPQDAIVGKGYTDTVAIPAKPLRGYIVHRIAVILPVTEGILENAANDLGIASESRIPRSRSLGHH